MLWKLAALFAAAGSYLIWQSNKDHSDFIASGFEGLAGVACGGVATILLIVSFFRR